MLARIPRSMSAHVAAARTGSARRTGLAATVARVARDDDAGSWIVEIEGTDEPREPARSALLTLSDGVIGARAGSRADDADTGVVAAGIYAATDPTRRSRNSRAGTTSRSRRVAPDAGCSTSGKEPCARISTRLAVRRAPSRSRRWRGLALLSSSSSAQRPRPRGRRLCACRPEGRRVPATAGSGTAMEAVASPLRHPSVRCASRPRGFGSSGSSHTPAILHSRPGPRRRSRRSRPPSGWGSSPCSPSSGRRGLPLVGRGHPDRGRSGHAARSPLLAVPSDGLRADRPQAALGAKGLSGPGYRGHVFWDTDVFVLPFLAATHPPAARALVGYRIVRLAAAQNAADRLGFDGARFPWESADSGEDITPRALPDANGKLVRILTGERESTSPPTSRGQWRLVPELERRSRFSSRSCRRTDR